MCKKRAQPAARPLHEPAVKLGAEQVFLAHSLNDVGRPFVEVCYYPVADRAVEQLVAAVFVHLDAYVGKLHVAKLAVYLLCAVAAVAYWVERAAHDKNRQTFGHSLVPFVRGNKLQESHQPVVGANGEYKRAQLVGAIAVATLFIVGQP